MRLRFRFDTTSPTFSRVAGRLRRATAAADRLLESGRPGEAFGARLEALEAEIDDARAALALHVRATLRSPMNEIRRAGQSTARRRSA